MHGLRKGGLQLELKRLLPLLPLHQLAIRWKLMIKLWWIEGRGGSWIVFGALFQQGVKGGSGT
jgi:hypothetical protein